MNDGDGNIAGLWTTLSGDPSARALKRCRKRSWATGEHIPYARYWFRVTGSGLFATKHALRVAVLEIDQPAAGGAPEWKLRGIVTDTQGLNVLLSSLVLASPVEAIYNSTKRTGQIDNWQAEQFTGRTIGEATAFAYELR